jgi:signal transduction histidine kinase
MLHNICHAFSNRFYRAESSRRSDGAGLGLALIKSIVGLHGGSAMIESKLGRGTIVKLVFRFRQNKSQFSTSSLCRGTMTKT